MLTLAKIRADCQPKTLFRAAQQLGGVEKKESTLMAGRELEGFLQNSEQHAVAHCLARMSTKI